MFHWQLYHHSKKATWGYVINTYFAFYIYPFLIPFGDKRWFPWWPLSAPCLLCTGRLMHLYAVCVDCLEGVHKIICIKCKSRWDGSWHQLGTMYTYDILAASPCCQVGIDPTEREAGDSGLLSPGEHRGSEAGGDGGRGKVLHSWAVTKLLSSPAVLVNLLRCGAAVTGLRCSHEKRYCRIMYN